MNTLSLLAASAALLLPVPSPASGFRCTADEGYRVKLYNYVDPLTGTRIPAVFVLSTAAQGTLLVREDEEIAKSNKTNVVRYTVEGNSIVTAEQVVLQIRFKEGVEELGPGETAPGQLIFQKSEDKKLYPLVCARYLKGDETELE